MRFTIYKNSFLATLLSILSLLPLLGGVGCIVGGIFGKEYFLFIPGIFCVVCFWGIKFAAETISQKKAFKTWVNQLKEKGIEEQISTSVDLAIYVYNNNKNNMTLNYIEKLNPQAGEIIRNHIAQQKEEKKQKSRKK